MRDAGLGEERIGHILADHRENDLPESAAQQLAYMRAAGFVMADLAWSCEKFAMFYAEKLPNSSWSRRHDRRRLERVAGSVAGVRQTNSQRDMHECPSDSVVASEHRPVFQTNDSVWRIATDLPGKRNSTKNYADEDERRRWAEDYPDEQMPEHAEPPFDRDPFLP